MCFKQTIAVALPAIAMSACVTTGSYYPGRFEYKPLESSNQQAWTRAERTSQISLIEDSNLKAAASDAQRVDQLIQMVEHARQAYVFSEKALKVAIDETLATLRKQLDDPDVSQVLANELVDVSDEISDVTGAGYDPYPKPKPSESQRLERLLELLKRAFQHTTSVDFVVTSDPSGAEWDLSHPRWKVDGGRCTGRARNIPRGRYILTVIKEGIDKACKCDLDLYKFAPKQVRCDLSVGGKCYQE